MKGVVLEAGLPKAAIATGRTAHRENYPIEVFRTRRFTESRFFNHADGKSPWRA
jgi:hypothetical protein